jgi:hypothetical protein
MIRDRSERTLEQMTAQDAIVSKETLMSAVLITDFMLTPGDRGCHDARQARSRPGPTAMTCAPVYDALTTAELTALQEALYTATERAYWVINLARENQDWLARYGPVHIEAAWLFLEAGEELLDRLKNAHKITAA